MPSKHINVDKISSISMEHVRMLTPQRTAIPSILLVGNVYLVLVQRGLLQMEYAFHQDKQLLLLLLCQLIVLQLI